MSTKSHARSERRKHLHTSPEATIGSTEQRIAGAIVVALLGAISFGTVTTE